MRPTDADTVCTQPRGRTPCTCLLDGSGTLPDHVCAGVARATVLRFVRGHWHPQQHTRMAGKVWRRLLDDCYPMPLGFGIHDLLHRLTHEIALEQAMQKYPIEELMRRSYASGRFCAWDIFREFWDLSQGPALSLTPLLELDDASLTGLTSLVIQRAVPNGYVRLFALTEMYQDGEQIAYCYGDPQMRLGGNARTAASIAGTLERWYRKTLLGERADGGRPAKPTPEMQELIDQAAALSGQDRRTARARLLSLGEQQGWYQTRLALIPNTRYERSTNNPEYTALRESLAQRVKRALEKSS